MDDFKNIDERLECDTCHGRGWGEDRHGWEHLCPDCGGSGRVLCDECGADPARFVRGEAYLCSMCTARVDDAADAATTQTLPVVPSNAELLAGLEKGARS